MTFLYGDSLLYTFIFYNNKFIIGTKSILIKSFPEKKATLKILPLMTSQLKFYLKSVSAGQKRAFFVTETYNL